jgi:hypothetical protein
LIQLARSRAAQYQATASRLKARFSMSAWPVRAQNRNPWLASRIQPAVRPTTGPHKHQPSRRTAISANQPASALGKRKAHSLTPPVTHAAATIVQYPSNGLSK